MLIPHCNCNRHFSFFHSETLLNPSFQIISCHYPKLRFKPLSRRASICAAAAEADGQTLPQSAIRRIAEKLRSLGYVEESSKDAPDGTSIPGPNSPGEIFVPLPTRLPKYRVGHTMDPSWSTPENPVPEPGAGNAVQRFHELRRGVLEEEEKERIRKRSEGKKKSAPSLAELTLPAEELRRLRSIGIGLKKKLKVGKAGITEGIVNGIHERWRRSELVKITCEDICMLNMKRTHELLERKTGGLVIWRSGSNIILYRGSDYKYPYFLTDKLSNDSSSEKSPDVDEDPRTLGKTGIGSPVYNAAESPAVNFHIQNSHPPLIQGVGVPNRVRFQLPGEAELAAEADALLEELGPRFTDWWGYDPLPVDADLLPAVVPRYKRPFRLLPYGVRPKLTNDEMTTLRRLARPLPCHFALGRNRKLQGLAASIVKLWEKCEIAKIAVKRGVQNTNSELMAEELKCLTGGTLLSRDREFIVFYRGKDFLPAAVSSAIEERRKHMKTVSKTGIGNLSILNAEERKHGTKEYAAESGHDEGNYQKLGRSEERKLMFSEAAMERTRTKLSMALAKKARAEKLLAQLEKEQVPQPPEIDKEGITEEERYMLRKMGLRMKPFLLLGRRGVFDGTIENMHLHWKYRELVKVCIGRRSIEEIHGIARTLEAESGGILVAIERVSKGYAIIMYRGKNYSRPASLRPRTLLSKREAMKRSLEAQRRESLKLHVLKLGENIEELRLKMAKDEDTDAMKLTDDLQPGFVEQGIDENHFNDDEISQEESETESDDQPYSGDLEIDGQSYSEKPESDGQSYFGEPANKARESHETGAASEDLEEPMHSSEGSVHIVQQDLQGDVSSQSTVKRNYLFATTEAEIQPRSLPNETKGLLNRNEQSGNAVLSYSIRSQDQTSSRTPRGRDSVGYRNTELESSVQKDMDKRPSARALQLSNKERLLLRKQALRMKKLPVLAVGKSNVITGLAKAIEAHFEKHPLAIVNIKGRAKGTSAQEVIYNLEQATGAVLVSQEPSKVILYRGWGSGVEPDPASGAVKKDPKYDSMGGKLKTLQPISPELISAIRLECGLKSVNGEPLVASEATADSSMDEFSIGN